MVDGHVEEQGLVPGPMADRGAGDGGGVLPEVEVDMQEAAQGGLAHELLSGPHGWVVTVVLAHGQHEAPLVGQSDGVRSGRNRMGERLFHQHMLVGQERRQHQGDVRREVRCHQYRRHLEVIERFLQRRKAVRRPCQSSSHHLVASRRLRVHAAGQGGPGHLREHPSGPVQAPSAHPDLEQGGHSRPTRSTVTRHSPVALSRPRTYPSALPVEEQDPAIASGQG